MSIAPLDSHMARDRSLDEFLGGDSDGSAASDAEPTGDAEAGEDSEADINDADPDASEESEADTNGADPDASEASGADTDPAPPTAGAADAEPAGVTYRWDPDGARCADCGATVERLWSGASEQVCEACKEW